MFNANNLQMVQTQNPELNNFLADFHSKAEKLSRILNKESEFFREMKIRRADHLLEAKTNLIEDLKELKDKIGEFKASLKSLPESEKEKIRLMEKGLTEVAEANYREALKAREVNLLIMEAISSAVNKNNQQNSAYGDNGGFAEISRSEANPITFVETV
jgi:lipid II:glycine glycyltransferase (peptidoglycan interpeptide bridge formation enzyme)